ncbi:MAG TPA: FxDxF family PEP-CTERM protein [Burkholderiaceae bacterium]
MKKILGIFALAAGLVASTSAMADTYNLGAVPIGWHGQFGPNWVRGAFSDTIDFTLSGASTISAGVGTLNFTVGGMPFNNINGLDMTVYTSGGIDLASGTDITLNNLAAGNYYAIVSGVANGSSGGYYSGAVAVSQVPEGNSVAMLLAGLGLLGYVVSWRKALF